MNNIQKRSLIEKAIKEAEGIIWVMQNVDSLLTLLELSKSSKNKESFYYPPNFVKAIENEFIKASDKLNQIRFLLEGIYDFSKIFEGKHCRFTFSYEMINGEVEPKLEIKKLNCYDEKGISNFIIDILYKDFILDLKGYFKNSNRDRDYDYADTNRGMIQIVFGKLFYYEEDEQFLLCEEIELENFKTFINEIYV